MTRHTRGGKHTHTKKNTKKNRKNKGSGQREKKQQPHPTHSNRNHTEKSTHTNKKGQNQTKLNQTRHDVCTHCTLFLGNAFGPSPPAAICVSFAKVPSRHAMATAKCPSLDTTQSLLAWMESWDPTSCFRSSSNCEGCCDGRLLYRWLLLVGLDGWLVDRSVAWWVG